MYSRENDNREDRYNGRPQYRRRSNAPTPLPEGFALYYIGAICPEDVNEKVSVYKQYMLDKYGSRAAQKSPAHLTIVPPFKAEEDMEKRLDDFVATYNFSLIPFEIQLKGFNHFTNSVLFVDALPNEALNSMEQELNTQFTAAFPSIIFRTKPMFHPHVTIATRDIPENRFEEIWDYFQQQEIEVAYLCKAVSLMKLIRGVWQKA